MAQIRDDHLKERVNEIRKGTGIPLTINWAYGKPRISLQFKKNSGAVRDLSPRAPNREIDNWLDGFCEGYDLALQSLTKLGDAEDERKFELDHGAPQ
jgi:hypothetical protein